MSATADAAASPVSAAAGIRGVLRVTPFRRLWYSTFLSSLGDWLGLLATTALAASLATGYSQQSFALGGVLLVRLLPAMVLGPVAGVFADRFNRRYTMVISDLIRFALFLTIPLAHLVVSADRTLWWLYVVTFFIECVSLFWLPAKDASVPNLVRRDQIEAANQLGLITTYGITPVLGALLFAALARITDALAKHLSFFKANPTNLALYFNAATFLVGALVVYFIKEISGSRGRGAPGTQPTLRSLAREAGQFLRTSRLLRGLIIGISGAFAAGGAVIGAGRFFVSSLGGGDAAYGVLFGAVFVGLGLGMAFGPRFAREVSRRRLFGLSIVASGSCLALTAVMPLIWLAVIFVVLLGFGAGNGYLAAVTLLGTEIDDQIRGRVFAILQTLIRVVLILSLAVVPFLVGAIGTTDITIGALDITVDGTRIVLFAAGLLAMGTGVLAYRYMDDKHHVSIWVDLVTSLRGDSTARRRLHSGGVFVAFEGGEGSGKSTQIGLLAASLTEVGLPVRITREPGATALGEQIRALVLHREESISPRAEALLFAADRAHHVTTVIRPSLDAGCVVLTDRYVDSSLAYQGAGRDLTMDEVRRISRWATDNLRPDLTILLDIDVEIGLARATRSAQADKLEAESVAFHQRVRQAFRTLAESSPDRYLVLDASLPPEELARQILVQVQRLLPARPHSVGSSPTATGEGTVMA
ncbi:thymidylate kinase [Jatrophihabitans sp. GAS493]|uniref:dTMP kinase n=1 Tax=Jatrophihabitans sp. GAS493 TaxID=1907575 RepID=UPI000BB74509|nr:dTMP kinase [Jatrophihabitans sp. GAS493]SOD72068.1 thymidylate kinase [Jatrophihabitans sp. GAS493]